MESHDLYVNGRWRRPAEGGYFPTITPWNRKAWAQAAEATPADVDEAVRAADAAFAPWRALAPNQRADLLRKLGHLIAERAEHLAKVESTDNGKIIRETTAQVSALPRSLEY